MNIAVAGTGYVGLSLVVLLSQNNNVIVVDIVIEKVEKMGLSASCKIKKYLGQVMGWPYVA